MVPASGTGRSVKGLLPRHGAEAQQWNRVSPGCMVTVDEIPQDPVGMIEGHLVKTIGLSRLDR